MNEINFNNLSPSEKRVAIAKDVLMDIYIHKLVPTDLGHWVSGPLNDDYKDCTLSLFDKIYNEEIQLQDFFLKKEQCTVCALGGLFVCAIKKFNDFKIGDLYKGGFGNDIHIEDIKLYLGNFFESHQLKLIEIAYEQGKGYYYTNEGSFDDGVGEYVKGNDAKLAEAMFDYIPNPTDRIKLIMENIIRNNGEFVPVYGI